MPKPAKIKKKKSFMFTTKHHSFQGVLGAIIAILTIIALIFVTYESFINRGKTSEKLGAIGLFSCILNVIGIICGLTAINERDVYRWLPIADMIVNVAVLIVWILYVALGMSA